MKSILYFTFLVSTILLLGAGCESNEQVEQQASGIQHKLDSAWLAMTASDDRKIANLELLVKECKMVPGIDSSRYTSFESGILNLKTSRYTQESMNTSSNIDDYDFATDTLLRNVKAFVGANPELEKYQVINQLLEEIGQADDSLIIYRQGYDKTLDLYNAFVTKHEKKITVLPAPYNTWKPRNYFRIAH